MYWHSRWIFTTGLSYLESHNLRIRSMIFLTGLANWSIFLIGLMELLCPTTLFIPQTVMEVSGPVDNARIIHNSHRVRKAGASASHHTHLSLWWEGITSRKQCHQYHQRWMCVATDKEKRVNYKITNSCLVVKFPNCLVSNHCHCQTMKFPCWHMIGGDNSFDFINLRKSVKF